MYDVCIVCEPTQWKALPKDIKDRYEERARVIAKKTSETSLSMSEAALYAGDSCSMSPYPATHLTASGTLPALLTARLFVVFYLLLLASFLLRWLL